MESHIVEAVRRSLNANLERLLKERGRSATNVSRAAGVDPGTISHGFKRGKRGPGLAVVVALAVELDVTLDELAGFSGLAGRLRGAVVPLAYRVCARFSPQAPDTFEVPSPRPILRDGLPDDLPDDAFAAEVLDASADGLYPPGTMLLCRPADAAAGEIELGANVLVRVFTSTRAEGTTMEVLAGVLDQSRRGDLLLAMQTSLREAARSVVIQEAKSGPELLAEATGISFRASMVVNYAPGEGDGAEILGVVIGTITPT